MMVVISVDNKRSMAVLRSADGDGRILTRMPALMHDVLIFDLDTMQ